MAAKPTTPTIRSHKSKASNQSKAGSKTGKPRINADLSSASKVLQALLANGKSPLSDQFLRWKIWRYWPTIVGAILGEICEPVGFERGKLIVWVKSSTRMQELHFFADNIKDKVNEHVGRTWVRSVRFTIDRRATPKLNEVPENFRQVLADSESSE